MAKQQKQKSQKEQIDGLAKVMKYSLKLNQEVEAKIAPGYYRLLKTKEEQVAAVLFQNKEFQEITRSLHKFIRNPSENSKMRQRIENRWAQSSMQHYEYNNWVRQPDFVESFIGKEMTKTYAWNLETEQYGGKGFDRNKVFRDCKKCGTTMDMWNACFDCYFHLTKMKEEDLEPLERKPGKRTPDTQGERAKAKIRRKLTFSS